MGVDKHYRELALAYEGVIRHGAGDGDLTLGVNDLVAYVVPPTSGATTVTLPNVYEARGRTYVIVSDGNATGTIDVAGDGSEYNDSGYASGSLTANQDSIVVKSDGIMWHELVSNLTAP